MQNPGNNVLKARASERKSAKLRVELHLDSQCSGQVVFSGTSGAIGPSGIVGELLDVSDGGIGVRTKQFLPRMCHAVARIFVPQDQSGIGSDLTEGQDCVEQAVTVRRTSMDTHDPTYLVGMSFNDRSPEAAEMISSLIERIRLLAVEDARGD